MSPLNASVGLLLHAPPFTPVHGARTWVSVTAGTALVDRLKVPLLDGCRAHFDAVQCRLRQAQGP